MQLAILFAKTLFDSNLALPFNAEEGNIRAGLKAFEYFKPNSWV